jgi:transglutaminase-like putative cysteine protease
MATYRTEHETRYVYHNRVTTSQHVAVLEPRVLPYQQHTSFDLDVEPAPARVIRRTDYFGNTVHQFQLLTPHEELRVIGRCQVDVHPRAPRGRDAGLSWEDARAWLAAPPADIGADLLQYVGRSPHVVGSADIAAFARESFVPGRALLDGALALMHRIHREFTFDPTATTPSTPVTKILAERRGVCQDFAHFQIACLRSLGLAARYVSGYLLTDPPPGQTRLIGADASHAWLAAYLPEHGWIDLDPTNGVIVGTRHVTIGWGRDYSDVTPLRGVLLGGEQHDLYVGVSVVPLDGQAG